VLSSFFSWAVAWGRRRRRRSVCVCVCVVCWSKQQAAHGATDMVLFPLSPVTSTHATHTTNFVCTFYILTQGIITEWQWITWLTCVLCAPKWIFIFYFWWQILPDFFPPKFYWGKILDINFLKSKLSNFFFSFFWNFFSNFFYITKLRGKKKGWRN
jgi:hypothetical protein